MSNIRRFVLLAGLVVAFSGLSLNAMADDPKPKDDAAITKDDVLAWIDEYRKEQVLFHDEDIARLRKELADDTPEEAAKWWAKSADVRAALKSPEWQETRTWLKEFLKVQAIYSDKDLAAFREEAKEAAKESPRKFIEMLQDVEAKRRRFASNAAQSNRLRQAKLGLNEAYRQEAHNSRQVQRQTAAGTSLPQRVTAPERRQYQRPRALVDSLDVARWEVMRNFWRW